MPSRVQTARSAAMSNLNSRMKKLKEKRGNLSVQISRIDQELSELQAKFGAIYNAPSRLLNLPAEITCIIFDFADSRPELVDSETEERELLSEVVISHVCKWWREIALSYSRMWSRFFYVADDISPVPLERFRAYLHRSASQSLELFLEFRDDPLGPKVPLVGDDRLAMLDMALAHIARWKIVTLRSDLDLPVMRRLRQCSSASAPKLEYFSFCPDVSGQKISLEEIDLVDGTNLRPTIFKGGAPKLDYVHLDGSGFIVPPISNITTLRIEAEDCTTSFLFGWSATLEMFSIPTLTNLSFVGNVFHPPSSFECLPLINMKNLKHLRYSDNEHMTLLISHIRAPLLETLSLRNIWMPEEFGTNSAMMPYFFPSLKSLTLIDSTASTPVAARHLVQLTQRAKTVLLSDDDPDENIFAMLRPHFDKKEIWPKLDTLIVNLNTEEEIELFNEMVASRPKKSLTLRIFKELEQVWKTDEPEQFAMLQEACTIDTLTAEDRPLAHPEWPPGGTCPKYANNHDPFEIDTYYMADF